MTDLTFFNDTLTAFKNQKVNVRQYSNASSGQPIWMLLSRIRLTQPLGDAGGRIIVVKKTATGMEVSNIPFTKLSVSADVQVRQSALGDTIPDTVKAVEDYFTLVATNGQRQVLEDCITPTVALLGTAIDDAGFLAQARLTGASILKLFGVTELIVTLDYTDESRAGAQYLEYLVLNDLRAYPTPVVEEE